MSKHLVGITRSLAWALLLGLAACGSSGSSNDGSPGDDPAVLQLVTVTPAEPSVPQGATQQLTATGKYSDGSTKDLTADVTWASLDPAIATVSGGLVQAGTLTGGRAVITATLGEQIGFTRVSVTGEVLMDVEVVPGTLRLPVGLGYVFKVLGRYGDGSVHDVTSAASWASADEATATTANGRVTGVAAGDTSVTATVNGSSATADVTVTTATLDSIFLTPMNAPRAAPGKVEAFGAFGVFTDGTILDLTEDVTWASASETVATVSNAAGTRGRVTAVAAGSAEITATLGAVTSPKVAFSVVAGSTDYTVARVPFHLVDMTGATWLLQYQDDGEAALPAVDGFTFDFYGSSFTTDQIHLNTNGVVFFGPGNLLGGYSRPIPHADDPDGFFAPYWQDLITAVSFKVVGTAPARQLVIQWQGFAYQSVFPVLFQAVLTEGTNQLEAHYAAVPPPSGAYCTIGVENLDGSLGTDYVFNQFPLSPGTALRFSP